MTRSSIALAVCPLVALGACLGLTDLDALCPPETQALNVTSTVGQAVVFDWEPACGVALLSIDPTDPGTSDVWQVRSESLEDPLATEQQVNRIAPPVTYGVAPAGSLTDTGPDGLVSGQSYRIGLYRLLPDNVICATNVFDGACFVASHTFTR